MNHNPPKAEVRGSNPFGRASIEPTEPAASPGR